MPRYFFDLHNDVEAIDQEGKEFPDVDAAKANLLIETREMIQTSVADTGRIDLEHHIDLRDESGAVICVMHFKDAVTVQRGTEVIS